MKFNSYGLALLVSSVFGAGCSAEPSSSLAMESSTPSPSFKQRSSALTAEGSLVSESKGAGDFTLFESSSTAPIFVSSGDFAGVIRVAGDLQSDIEKVSGTKPTLSMSDAVSSGPAIIVGTLGKSALIDGLVTAGKIDLTSIQGKWESFIVQVVDQPFDGVDQALVIAGSDKRGTIFGVYELSEEMGVSPWHYWADVPPRSRSALYVTPGPYSLGEPAVKYRGLFINDESPGLSDWYAAAFKPSGTGFHSDLYEKVFELILRMKGNYLWPGMWGKSFNVDDPQNPILADEYGIVMGTSHHEPLTRSEQEWYDAGHADTDWSYTANGAVLRDFWKAGVQRMGTRESLLTVGMRGSGDVPNPDQGIPLMETIVTDQRKIIQDVTGQDPTNFPQVWTLYKEVQSYYDGGLVAPDDVTLMFSDDNWGNLRRLPAKNAAPRSGGYGIYYHYDYVGGPRSYKWLNTNPIPRVWEQMRRAYHYGADKIWIVNVGDLKPMEYPLHFFMDLAWDPDGWTAARLADYPRRWASAQFGDAHAEDIGRLISQYSKFNGRRKPELLSDATYSLANFREADRVVNEYNALVADAQTIEAQLPPEMKDAYFELVLFPILACANLNEMYVSVAKNKQYSDQGRASTNDMAQHVSDLFANDTTITNRYNTTAGGKWNQIMKQTHIGYTTWDQPAAQVKPSTVTKAASGAASIGVAIEGSSTGFTPTSAAATLPELSVYYPTEERQLEVFNRGTGTFDFTTKSDVSYVSFVPSSGSIGADTSVVVKVDWTQVPKGDSTANLTISGAGGDVKVQLPLRNPDSPAADTVIGFVESAGYISVDASHYTDKVDQGNVGWSQIPDLGRTGSAVHIQPDDASSVTPGGATPQLHYKMYFLDPGQVQVQVYLSPSLPVLGANYRVALSFDDEQPQMVDMHAGLPSSFNDTAPIWEGWVSDNIITKSINATIGAAGEHTLKLWMVDTGVVVQKIVVSRAGLPSSYLGAPSRLPLNFKVEEVVPDHGSSGGPGGVTGTGGLAGTASGGDSAVVDPGAGSGAAPAGTGGLSEGSGAAPSENPDGSQSSGGTAAGGKNASGCACSSSSTGRGSSSPVLPFAAGLAMALFVLRRLISRRSGVVQSAMNG